MSRRVLVVEDQEDHRQILRDFLGSAGYDITEAENGEQALCSIADQRPDLILMDIQLPVLDGYEATRHQSRSQLVYHPHYRGGDDRAGAAKLICDRVNQAGSNALDPVGPMISNRSWSWPTRFLTIPAY